jgi:hypothetical protein
MLTTLDPLPHWAHPDHRPSEDVRLLCPEAEAERNSSLHGWYTSHSPPLAPDWVYHRDVWYLRSVWGFLRNHWLLRWQYPYHWALYPNGVTEIERWKEERGTPSVITGCLKASRLIRLHITLKTHCKLENNGWSTDRTGPVLSTN